MLASLRAPVKASLTLSLLAACSPDAPRQMLSDRAQVSIPDTSSLPAVNGDPALMRGPGPANGLSRHLETRSGPLSWRGSDAVEMPRNPALPEAPYAPLLDQIGPPLEDVRLNEELGAALTERLEEEDERDVDDYGVAVLTADEIWGTSFSTGYCEAAEVLVEGEEDGVAYTARIDMPTFYALNGEPEAQMRTLDEACIEELLANAGDVDGAVGGDSSPCDSYDEAAFFEEGSACRDCLEAQAGDYEACVDDGECAAESPYEYWVAGESPGERVWWDAAIATMWACAPDWNVEVVLLGEIADDGTLPDTFDHERWGYLCIPTWVGGAPEYTCVAGSTGPTIGDALLEGMILRVNSVDYEDGRAEHGGRVVFTHKLDMVGHSDVTYIWGFSDGGAGVISMPQIIPDSNGNGVTDIGDENFGFGLGGWGINPHALRPDGTDPEVLDDTMARDWLGVATMKFSTNINGITIHVANHNRCAEDAWEGPFEDGSYRCTRMEAPTGEWPLDDVNNTWTDSSWTQAYAMPMATIASTGLPDPDAPTGAIPHVAGSAALANEDWEGCTWPHQFVPDLAPMEDTPGIFGERASLWGDTYRFGKDPDQDIRVVLTTNRERDFCPPEGWNQH